MSEEDFDQVDETVIEDQLADEITEEVEVEEATDEQGGDEEVEEYDVENVEFNGKEYAVPKELKEALMRQDDYTRKTQEVAEQRKALETSQQEFQQAQEVQKQNLEKYAQFVAIDNQVKQYQDIDWNQWSETDPETAQKAFFQYSQLKDAAQRMATEIQQTEQETLQKQQSTIAKQKEQGRQALAKAIPDWSPQLATEIQAHGETYGYSPQELEFITDPTGCIDPRAVQVLHDALRYRKSLKRATAKPKPAVKPVTAIKSKSSGKKDMSKMSTSEWIRERNKQLARQT